MGFLLEKCKLVKLDDKILEICHHLKKLTSNEN